LLDNWRAGPLTMPQQFIGLWEGTRSPSIDRDRNLLPYQFRFIEISKASLTEAKVKNVIHNFLCTCYVVHDVMVGFPWLPLNKKFKLLAHSSTLYGNRTFAK
jgi:hypothetical protein